MKRLILALPLLVGACATGTAPASPAKESFMEIFDGYIAERARLDPSWATRIGIHDHDERLTRNDDASYDARRALVRRTLDAMRKVDASRLEPQDAIDARLFIGQLEVDDFDYTRRDYRTVSPAIPCGAADAVNELLIKDFAPREKRVACAVARLRQLPAACDDARAKLGRPPHLWTEMAIDDLGGAAEFIDTLSADAPE